MRCVPLFLLFVALAVVSLLCIAALVTILNTILVTEATRHAEDAVHAALSHAAGVVASPFDDTEPLVHRLASEALAASDFLNDGRTAPAAVAPTWRRYLGVDRGTQAPLYAVYQTFMVNASNYSWTFSGCFPDDNYCIYYRPPNGIATMPTTGHPNLNLTIRSTDTGAATWNFTGSPFAERVRRLTAADKGGKWGDPELFYDQVTKATVPFITFHVPVLFDAQDRCLLSENIDLKANKIKAALLEIEVPATHFIVVHRSMGTLLATTFDLPPFNETVVPAPNPGGTPTVTTALWTATRTANSELNEATALLNEKNAIGFEQCLGRNKACACVEIRGRHIYGVRPVSRRTGLDLVVITVTPKSEFFATLATARWLGIGIGIACAVVCVAVAALVTVLIKRALQQLQAAMVPAARLKCDPAAYRAQGLSFVADIAELEEAFAVMNDKLHEAGAYLPQSVKAAWEAEDGEGPSPTDSFDDDKGHASDDTSSSAPFSDTPSKLPPGVHNARASRSGGEEDLRSVSSEGTAMDSLSDILSTLTSGHSDDQAARTVQPQPQHLEPRRATVGGQGARKACPSQGASPLSTASSYDERSASPRPAVRDSTTKRWCGVGPPTSHGAAVAPATTATHTNSPAGAGASNTTGAFSPPAKTSLLNPLTSRRHMAGGAAPASSTASATTATFSSGGRNGGGGNNNANNSPSDALPVPRRIKPKQRCTVVHLSVVGFQRIAEAAQFDEIARRSEATTDLVVTTAKALRGVIDAFTGDSFVVTFNAVTQCSSHQRKGAAFVFALREAMQEVTRKERDGTLFRRVDQNLEGSRDAVKPMSTSLRAAPTVTFKKMSTSGAAAAPSGHFNLPLSCGMASGTVTIGDLGSRAMRRVSVIGKAPAHAAVLERLCRAYIDTAWSAAARRHQEHSMSAASGSNQNQSQLLQSLQQQQQQQAQRGSEAVPQVFGPDCFTANAFARRRSHAAKATKSLPHEPSVAAPAPLPHGGFEEKETLQDDQASLMAPSTVSNSEDELVTSRSASVKKSGAFVVASAVAAPIAIEGDSQNPSPAFGSLAEHPAPSFTVSTSNMNGVAGAKLRGQLRTPHKGRRGSNSVVTDITLPDGCGGVSCSTLRDFGCGPVPCVVSQSLVEDLSVNFSSEVVDFIRLPQQRAATLVSVLTAPKGNEAEEANDEWLYVIPGSNDAGAGAEGDPANALETVVSRAASGQLRRAADAAPYFQSYLARHGVTPATVAVNVRGSNAPAWATPHTGSAHDGTASGSGLGPGRACMACAMAALASRNAGRLMHQHSKERAEGSVGKTAYAGRALGDYYDHSVGGALC